MSARQPGKVRPISLTWLAGISLTTFLVVFLLLEVVDPRWIGMFRASATPTPFAQSAQATPRTVSGSAARRRPGTPQPAGQTALASGSPAVPPGDDGSGPSYAAVVETQGQGARLRGSPSSQAAVLAVLREGSRVQLTGQEAEAEDRIWFEVLTPNGVRGWIAGDFLAAAEPPGGR